jgi:hypothetical protein
MLKTCNCTPGSDIRVEREGKEGGRREKEGEKRKENSGKC